MVLLTQKWKKVSYDILRWGRNRYMWQIVRQFSHIDIRPILQKYEIVVHHYWMYQIWVEQFSLDGSRCDILYLVSGKHFYRNDGVSSPGSRFGLNVSGIC